MNLGSGSAVSGSPLGVAAVAAGPLQVEHRCFTIIIGEQTFGLPVENIQTVFEVAAVTPVPLAPVEITGLVNLRGKIVTAVSLRRRLRLADIERETASIAVGVDFRGESYALIVDEVGDVLTLDSKTQIETPPHLGLDASTLATVHCLDGMILPILNLAWIFAFDRKG